LVKRIKSGETDFRFRKPGASVVLSHIAEDLRPLAKHVDDFELDPKNPRQGDVELIASSLETHGFQNPAKWFYPFPGSEQARIIVGNHRIKAAKMIAEKRGPQWLWVPISRYIGTPEQAQAFALMDNKSSDDATYNEAELYALLKESEQQIKDGAFGAVDSMRDLTGYSSDDFAYLMSRAAELSQELGEDEVEIGVDDSNGISGGGDEAYTVPTEELEEQETDILRHTLYPSYDPLGLPDLRWDMLADPPDQQVRTWATERFSDMSWQHYWWLLWNHSTRNAPFDRSYLCFYSDDESLLPLWNRPHQHVGNFLKLGLKAVVGPDFSTSYDMPYAELVFNMYRISWMQRYYQECGIPVIPNLKFAFTESNESLIGEGIPVCTPCVATQVQTITTDPEDIKRWKVGLDIALRKIEPDCLIMYGSRRGIRIMEKVVPTSVRLVKLASAQDVRRNLYKPDPVHGKATTYKKRQIKKEVI